MLKHSMLFLALIVTTACGAVESTPAVLSSVDGIVNFHEVHPHLFRSGRLETRAVADLADMGIRSILNLEDDGSRSSAIRAEQAAAAARDLEYFRVPMSGSNRPTLAQIERALDIIVDTANQPILVHCYRGSDRTGIVMAAYRIRYDHWSKEDAITELRSLGHTPILYWWDDILDQI